MSFSRATQYFLSAWLVFGLLTPAAQAGLKKNCAAAAEELNNDVADVALDGFVKLVKRSRDAKGKEKSRLLVEINQRLFDSGRTIHNYKSFRAFLELRLELTADVPFRIERDIDGVLEALIRERNNFPASERAAIVGKIRSERLKNTAERPSMNLETEITNRFALSLIETAIEPTSFMTLLDHLPDYTTRGGIYIGTTHTMRVLVESLPEPQRRQLLGAIRERFSLMTADVEKRDTEENDTNITGAKATRRQLDALEAMVARKELQTLVSALKAASSKEQRLVALEEYIGAVGSKTGIERGGYGAKMILDAAQTIANGLERHFDSEGDRYIQLYGSFSNGKASLQKSDIDCHFSESMKSYYVDAYGSNTGKWYRGPEKKSTANGKRLFSDLTSTEEQLNKLFRKDDPQPGGVISLSTHRPDAEGLLDNFAHYSPVIIKISGGRRVEIQTYDALDTRTLNSFAWSP